MSVAVDNCSVFGFARGSSGVGPRAAEAVAALRRIWAQVEPAA